MQTRMQSFPSEYKYSVYQRVIPQLRIYGKSKERKKIMKTIKKFSAIVIAVLMVLAMSAPAFAAGDGKITITNAVKGQDYTVYQIFELDENSDTENGKYLYTVKNEWKAFVATHTGFVSVDENDYVVINESLTDDAAKEAAAAAFAKAAIAYAKANTSTITGITKSASDDKTVVFEGLDLGYYLVDSSVGTICALDTTDKEVTIVDKNDEPIIDKEVQEDDNSTWGKTNTAGIGETVNYRITVTAQPGAANYVVHDTLSSGLTLNADSIEIAGLTKGTDYTVNTDATDDCIFEIRFAKAYLDTITEKNTKIVITYNAVVNKDALIYELVNPNEVILSYGEDATVETAPAKTETLVFRFDVVKTTSDGTLLNGAKFKLYDAAENGNVIKLIADGDNLRVATAAEIAAGTGIIEEFEIADGTVTVEGFDNGNYYLEETVAPTGYNKLKERVKVEIANGNKDAAVDLENSKYTEGGVQVINKTGAELPSTGGMGTTVLYVIGALLVVGAVIVLVSRRRMSCEA
ncbi:MAG: isopeptide-forming domain-containing fimbrial protein [Ruminococcaceae bacterium]|nr:isopeptide-forming domain-containing fimbrial protein [Oscillospiraceae bacterium]